MTRALIFGKKNCSFCDRAKNLLDKKSISYTYFDVEDNQPARREMFLKNPAAKTVPQIWLDGNHIGGYTELENCLLNK